MSLRALASIYTIALFSVFVTFSFAAITLLANKTIVVESKLLARSNYYPRITISVNDSLFCINITDNNIDKVIIDQGNILKIINFNKKHINCVEIDTHKNTVVLVHTRYGNYYYTPANDPAYAGCAPKIYVFKPVLLRQYIGKCKNNLRHLDTSPAYVAKYLDPVFSWYLGFPKAEHYRGLFPHRIEYTSEVYANTMIFGYKHGKNGIVWHFTLDDIEGIAIAGGSTEIGKRYPIKLCEHFEKLPYRDKICEPVRTRTGKVVSFRPKYDVAYNLKIPVYSWLVARFPGFWIFIGNGTTSSYATLGMGNSGVRFAEASILLDNGTIIPLIWGDGYHGIKCAPKEWMINRWRVALTCKFLGQAYSTIPIVEVTDPNDSLMFRLPSRFDDESIGYTVEALPTSYVNITMRYYYHAVTASEVTAVNYTAILFSERDDTKSQYLSTKTIIRSAYPYYPSYITILNITIDKYKKP